MLTSPDYFSVCMRSGGIILPRIRNCQLSAVLVKIIGSDSTMQTCYIPTQAIADVGPCKCLGNWHSARYSQENHIV